ncbi:MAG: hypothetical protein ABH886_01455 [Candidatus Desantisbacteria bacterium]
MQKNVLLWIIGIALLMGTPILSSASIWTSGTAAGEKIVSGGDVGIINIADVAGDVIATFKFGGSGTINTTCAIATVTVGQIYGGKWGTLTNDQNGSPGATVGYVYQIYNLGNATGVFNLSINTTGLPTGWTAILSTTTITVAEDAIGSFTVQVTMPTETVANDRGTIIVTASTTVDDGAAYVVGSYQYGGTDLLTDNATTTCSSAIIAMTKTYEVQDPGSYTGTSTNVPGSVVTYCLQYCNTGNISADNVTITDMIPKYTTYVTGKIRIGTAGSMYTTAVSEDDNAVDGVTLPYANWNVTTPGAVTFSLGSVAAGAAGRLYYQVRID